MYSYTFFGSAFSADNIISFTILAVIDALLTPLYIVFALLGTYIDLGNLAGGRFSLY